MDSLKVLSFDVDLFGQIITKPKPKKNRFVKVIDNSDSDNCVNKGGPVYVEVTKLLPHYSVIYAREISGFFNGRKSDMPKFNQPVAGISDRGARRLGSALNWMVLFSPWREIYSKTEKRWIKFKINFITLTIPSAQMHSDHYIKQHMLAPFLKWMQRSWKVISFIWKAEAQDNGNIHFHITTNMFIHWKAIRGKWNRLCAKHGYCKVFQDGTNDKGDAATSVKSVVTMKGIVSYLKGYITKKDLFKKKLSTSCPLTPGIMHKRSYRQVTCLMDGASVTREYKRPIDGKLWATSRNLSKINCVLDMESDPDYYEVRDHMMKDSKMIFEDKYIKIATHRDFNKATNHPTISAKLKDIFEKHFSQDSQQKTFEIESFY